MIRKQPRVVIASRSQTPAGAKSVSPLPSRVFLFVTSALLWVLAAIVLVACGGGGAALSGVRASADRIVPGSHGIGNPPGVLEVRYTLGSAEQVNAQLQGPATATLLSARQDAGEHILRFTGVISDNQKLGDSTLVRRVVPSGDYTINIASGGSNQSVHFKVDTPASASTLPTVSNLVVKPEVISPNADAVDDQAEMTFRTNETATLRVDLSGADGTHTLQFAPQEKGPGEQNIVVTGQDLAGNALPNGAYTITLQVEDAPGNRVEATHLLTIQGGGQPSIEILKVEIAPQQITLGSSIAVSVTVRNTGDVPLRTQGPDPGYTYTTNDSYSSIEGGKWTDKAGLWRVGVDWDGNSGGGGPYRYPFRWGFGKTLMPGETVITGGHITILKQERRMWFYAGVLQEGIRIVLDRLGRTPVDVSF